MFKLLKKIIGIVTSYTLIWDTYTTCIDPQDRGVIIEKTDELIKWEDILEYREMSKWMKRDLLIKFRLGDDLITKNKLYKVHVTTEELKEKIIKNAGLHFEKSLFWESKKIYSKL